MLPSRHQANSTHGVTSCAREATSTSRLSLTSSQHKIQCTSHVDPAISLRLTLMAMLLSWGVMSMGSWVCKVSYMREPLRNSVRIISDWFARRSASETLPSSSLARRNSTLQVGYPSTASPYKSHGRASSQGI